jgi:nucleoside 2-deoxyribosyltransferase
VFRADAVAEGARLKALCEAHGLDGVYPLDGSLDLAAGGRAAILSIYASCCAQIQSCHGVIANLSPFRGPHADDGTAFEMGYAAALSRPIMAYSRDLRPMIERVPVASRAGNVHRDAEGYEIENFGAGHNAMLAGAAMAVHASAEEAIAAMAMLLAAS